MKYRVVNVYTGYGENSIEDVELLEHNGDLESAAKLVEKGNLEYLRNDGADEDHLEEFFTGVHLNGDVAGVSNGEENVLLVIPATSVWFDRVTDEDSLYDNHSVAWDELIHGGSVLS